MSQLIESHAIPAPSREHMRAVRRGEVIGESIVHKFGRNPTLPNGTFEFMTPLGHTGWPLSAPTAVRIKAGGDVADDASGAGARQVVVQGLNDEFKEVQEAIVTAGGLASTPTTTLFWRPQRLWVSAVGTYGAANTDNIIIENAGGGTDLIMIAADEGQSQFGPFTIPGGKTGYLIGLGLCVSSVRDADFRVFLRKRIDITVGAIESKRIKVHFDGVGGFIAYKPESPEFECPAKSDLWIEGAGSGGVTAASAGMEIWLIDN